jgi:hypothetical protein
MSDEEYEELVMSKDRIRAARKRGEACFSGRPSLSPILPFYVSSGRPQNLCDVSIGGPGHALFQQVKKSTG